MKRRLVLGLAVALPLWSLSALAAPLPPGVTTTVEPTRVRLGEPFHYRVAITRPTNERFDLVPPAGVGAFELRGVSRRRDDGATSATTTFDLTLALYDLDPHALPALTLDAARPDGRARLAIDGPTVTAVRSSSKPGDKLLDIEGPVNVLVRSWRLIVAALALALLAVATFFGARRWRTRRRSLEWRTRAALDALARAELPAHGRTQEFFFTLDDIVRRHLGARLGFDGLDCTTPELLARLGAIDALALPLDELTHFVCEADLVKFARASADLEAAQAALAFAYRLVEMLAAPPVQGGAHARAAVS